MASQNKVKERVGKKVKIRELVKKKMGNAVYTMFCDKMIIHNPIGYYMKPEGDLNPKTKVTGQLLKFS